MAIEPIKGFYVHDEVTDTDGVAKYDAGALENLDRSLTERYRAPDSKAVGDRLSAVEAVADEANQIAERLNEGGLELKDEVLAENISAWLSEHPEATTTVQDGALTQSKLSNSLDARKPSFYSTVSEMQEDEQYRLGATAISDGAVYTVRSAVEVNDPEDMVDPSVLYKYDGQYYHGGLTESDRQIATGYECVNGFALFVAEYKNAYVTPEMFGAKGDGVADDTRAWQKAVDVGLTVIAQSLIYKCGQVDITKNINVDCNNAKFVCTSEYLFKPSGAVTATLTGQGDYTANQTDFKISDTTYANYSGYGMICGDNNWQTFRTYYYGGMVGNFKNGYFYDRIPVDATNATVLIVNPIVCTIKNISECEFTNTHDGKIIYCSYGTNCRFENINVTKECYHIVAFYRCYKCTGVDIYAPLPMYSGAAANTYPTACLDSCFCTIENSYIYNPFWHAWTTGSQYVCYNNKVLNCEMFSDRQCAIEDHENAIDTYVSNTTTNGINLAQGGTIENIIMEPRNDTNKNCIINFAGSTVKTLARYMARNVVFRKTQNNVGFGFAFKCYPQTSGNTAYYNKVDLQNIYNETVVNGDNLARIEMPYSDNEKLSSCVLGTFRIDNTNIRCNLQQGNATMYDNTYSKIVISNCRDIMNIATAGQYEFYNPVATADMYIENSVIGWTGTTTYKNVTFNNVEFNTAPTLNATGIIKGSNVSLKTGLSASTKWNNTNVVNITNLTEYTATTPTIYGKLWRTSSNANMYGEKSNADGTTTIVTLVTV